MTPGLANISTQIPGVSTQTVTEEQLFLRLKAGHTLVTANSRLTRVLADRYNDWRFHHGDRQWKSPDICSWTRWVDHLWEQAGLLGAAGTGKAVPGARQLISLWESTLKQSPLAGTLLRPEALAGQLSETRKLVSEWLLDPDDPAWTGFDNENHAAFKLWNQAFDQHCRRAGWIDPHDRYPVIRNAINTDLLRVTHAVDLVGFDEFAPARSGLLKALAERGVPVNVLSMPPNRDQAVLWQSKDSRDELQKMARWVRYWYEKEPACSIAVVVPELHSRRREIDRVLTSILAPGSLPDAVQKPWNISMGVPLSKVQMMETAFDLFKLLEDRIDIQEIGRLLRSPWLPGAQEERRQRALLEKCIREKYPRQLKLSELIYRASEIKKHDRYGNELPAGEWGPQPWNCPDLHGLLKVLSWFKNHQQAARPASAWAESFDHLLTGLGWPSAGFEQGADETQQDQTWQILQSWREALRELASLDATDHSHGRRTALKKLRQVCREKIFQAHTPATRIQVLGLYEISALRFDHLWVLGLHNDNWPESARPNPFIPGELQRRAGIPNSSPQRELELARVITRRLLETAPDCVFSFPGTQDGEALLPSPLIRAEGVEIVEEIPHWQGKDWCNTVAAAEKPLLEGLQMPGRVVHGTARGGSSILKHQALCPFRAFASNRLGAESMETPVDGISPALHGSLVHKVLELFWVETGTQAALLQLSDTARAGRVRKYVTQVTEEERGLKLRPAFLKVEADRVHRHVMEYLALEMQREPFEVIGFEKEILPEIAGQRVRLVIDRIDRVASGEEVIIDYKTGKVEPAKWFGERPEDPQLPLYAISAASVPAAVCFGILREDGCLYKGVVSREGLLPGLPPSETRANQALIEAGNNMASTIGNWRQILHRLMVDFLSGDAAIDPKNENTCQNSYCELHSLCRIDELRKRQLSAMPGASEMPGPEAPR